MGDPIDAKRVSAEEMIAAIVGKRKGEQKRREDAEPKPKATVTVLKPAKVGKPKDEEKKQPLDEADILEGVDFKEEPKEKPKEESKEEPKEESKAETSEEKPAEEEEAVASELNPAEKKRRQIIRWRVLKWMNNKYAVIASYGGRCVVMREAQSPIDPKKKVFDFQFPNAFLQWNANKFIPSLMKENKNDAVGPWWFRHPKRRQYDGVVFKPLADKVIETPDRQSILNTYMGWGVEPKKGEWPLIRRHIKEVLANNDLKSDEYILRWTAWGFQHPNQLPLVALVLIGRKGRGKGTFARVLERIYGVHHSIQISSQKHLVGNFNKHLENLILLIADEAYWAGHKADAGTLQRMITEPTLVVEPKGVDVRIVRNYIHLLMLAEPGWTVPAGPDERRYAVNLVNGEAKSEAYFKALYKEIDGDGPAAMLYDLLHMDLGDWHPRQVYKTSALRRQQDLSLPPLEQWLLTLLEDGRLPYPAVGKPYAATPTNLANDAKGKVPRLRDLSFNELAEFLEEWGCSKAGGDQRLWRFPALKVMRGAWDQKYVPREWLPISDWFAPEQPPLEDLLKDVLKEQEVSKADKAKLLEMSKALSEKRPNETPAQANSRIYTSILMRNAADGDSIALSELLRGRSLSDFFNAHCTT
jgi:hypothetical protein